MREQQEKKIQRESIITDQDDVGGDGARASTYFAFSANSRVITLFGSNVPRLQPNGSFIAVP
jgi:hypothetical protein